MDKRCYCLCSKPRYHGVPNWWESVLTPPLSANSVQSNQSNSSCQRNPQYLDKHGMCTDGCNKILADTETNRFRWDRSPYDKLCYDRCPTPDVASPHHGAGCCERQVDYCEQCVVHKHCCTRQLGVSQKCCRREQGRLKPPPPVSRLDQYPDNGYTAVCCKSKPYVSTSYISRGISPLALGKVNLQNLMPVSLSPENSHLHFPGIPVVGNRGSNRTRAYSCEAAFSLTSAPKDAGQKKNAVTSPTMPLRQTDGLLQSNDISSTTLQENGSATSDSNPDDGIASEEDYKSNTVNRATSPFIVKTATQVNQIPNDPAVKSLVKSVVMFNDVEYQVPTKIIRKSKSQEIKLDCNNKENIYWEVDTPLKPPPQHSSYSFLCTTRTIKEGRNVSADSIGSITPLLKRKSAGGFFKLGRSSKSKHSSCLNGKLLRGMMSRKSTENTSHHVLNAGVSRVKIFNTASERYEAPVGRHTVQIPTNTTDQTECPRQPDKQAESGGKINKQSALGRLFKRKSAGGSGVKWKINPEYYSVRNDSSGSGVYVLPDDTFESVEL